MVHFKNREQAARQLADRLSSHRGELILVVGIPPAPVLMARTIADTLAADVDVALVRHLRAPSDPAQMIGAIDENGAVVKGRHYAEVPPQAVREEVRTRLSEIRAARIAYTRVHPPTAADHRTVIVVDDGSADLLTMLAAIRSFRERRARRVVVAVAVGHRGSIDSMRREADDLVCLHTCDDASAVDVLFDDFAKPSEDQVTTALRGRSRWAALGT